MKFIIIPARAGSKGIACSLISHKEAHKVMKLETYLNIEITPEPLPAADVLNKAPTTAVMTTIQIDGGKKQKVRAGDILGALTSTKKVAGNQIGKIQLFDLRSYVAVERSVAKAALKTVNEGKMKGRNFRARILG